jgi:hypothetical protein
MSVDSKGLLDDFEIEEGVLQAEEPQVKRFSDYEGKLNLTR